LICTHGKRFLDSNEIQGHINVLVSGPLTTSYECGQEKARPQSRKQPKTTAVPEKEATKCRKITHRNASAKPIV
jgi:hypothetical protein